MLAWLYLIIAACFEMAWIYSLKFLDFAKITHTPVKQYFQKSDQARILIPLAGYIFFGVCNIFFFSKALKQIPVSSAFAIWMALTLAGSKVIDVLVMGEQLEWRSLVFILLILVGITGLKWTSG